MVDHAFGSLGLHRVALSVFAFNERAIRAYLRVGFVTEGRAREAIWRDGRWWDELHMSVLEPEWRSTRWQERAVADGRRAAREREGVAVETHRLTRGELRCRSTGPAADAARAAFREEMDAKGHASRTPVRRPTGSRPRSRSGALVKTPALDGMLSDLSLALEQDEGQKLGGKSAEAARFILRAISRELDNA